jgi:hypothetical protein
MSGTSETPAWSASAPTSTATLASALLDLLSGNTWRACRLGAAAWLPDSDTQARAEAERLVRAQGAGCDLDRAWLLAEALGRTSDRRLGRYCTPRSVALQLAGDVGNHAPAGALVDPACGPGALILARAQIESRRFGRFDFRRVVALDVDARSVDAAQAVMWLAAGQPQRPAGHFLVRDFLLDGFEGLPDVVPKPASTHAAGAKRPTHHVGASQSDLPPLLLANPPWGIKPTRRGLATWRRRVGPAVAGLLEGEVNIYTLFLLEALLTRRWHCGFVTPIHWLYRRSLARLRRRLAATQRLRSAFILRKRVFRSAPDMIPALTVWSAEPAAKRPIQLQRTGMRARLPLPHPLPRPVATELLTSEWRALPHAVLPVLRTAPMRSFAERFLALRPRLSDPCAPRPERLFHVGDGAYKSRVMPHVDDAVDTGANDARMPILTRAAEVGRYRLTRPRHWLSATGVAHLTDGERRRFERPKLLLHALKKASARWRLAAAIDGGERGPLAATNNLLLVVPESYPGDLAYPLALLNSRLYNRLYTEHFPGVNIEAFTVGVLPCPWPPQPSPASGPPAPLTRVDGGNAEAAIDAFYDWSRELSQGRGRLTGPVYTWLRSAAHRLQAGEARDAALDRRVEAVVAGLVGLPVELLELLLAWDGRLE